MFTFNGKSYTVADLKSLVESLAYSNADVLPDLADTIGHDTYLAVCLLFGRKFGYFLATSAGLAVHPTVFAN